MDLNEAYRVLSLTANCTEEVLRTTWRNLVLRHHPDRYEQFGETEYNKAQARTMRINRAYSIILAERNSARSITLTVKKGAAPNSEAYLRKLFQNLSQTQTAIEYWQRYLKRSRVSLNDVQRLTADNYANQKEYLLLRVALQATLEKRDAATEVLLETQIFRSIRNAIKTSEIVTKDESQLSTVMARLLPTEPDVLLPLLADLQSLSDDTLLQVSYLQRRFDKLEDERTGLGQRIKLQHRNLKQSLRPFIEAAQSGREKLDQTDVMLQECRALLKIEKEQGSLAPAVIKSRMHQLEEQTETIQELQQRQIEGDAAEAVYAQLLAKQSKQQSLSNSTFAETERVSEQIHILLQETVELHTAFPQKILSDVETKVREMIRKA